MPDFCIIASQNCSTTASQTSASTSESSDRIYCVSSVRKSFIIYENDYIQWLLLLFFMIFSASLSGGDYFVLFESLDGNGACSQMFNAKLNSQLWMETHY